MKSRRAKIFIAFILILGGGYTGISLWKNASGAIPEELARARVQGALISENIVNLSSKSASDLNAINQLDKEGKYTEALELTTNVIKQSQEIRDKAIALSDQIGTMTKSLSGISSLEARQALLDSITSRLALVSRLINYSGYLGQLLDVLRDHFAGVSFKEGDVAHLVDQINSEVSAINSFNSQAAQSMEKFDKILGK
ncbi:MAG: hypothetical protein AAB602_03700 [Patescibacteria group bacterium]